MRLGVIAGQGRDWKESLQKVRIAEGLGYELVVCAFLYPKRKLQT